MTDTEINDEVEVDEADAEETDTTVEEEATDTEVEKIRLALAKANKEAAKYRHELKQLKTQNESDTDKVNREAVEAVTAKWQKVFVQSEAKAQLAQMGLTAGADRFVKMIDFDEVTVDDDGQVDGLNEQLLIIKADFPEVFKKRVPKVDQGQKPQVDQGTSSAHKLLAQLDS